MVRRSPMRCSRSSCTRDLTMSQYASAAEKRVLHRPGLALSVQRRGGRRDFRQALLDRIDLRKDGARQRKREQRHHPVDLDLDQPLHQARRLRGAHAGVERQPARAAAARAPGVDDEVGEHPGRTVEDARARQRVAVEPAHQFALPRRFTARRQQHDIGRGDQPPGKLRQLAPGEGAEGARKVLEVGERGLGQRPHQRETDELAVPLPFHAQLRPLEDDVRDVGGISGGRLAEHRAQRGQDLVGRRIEQREARDRRRRTHRRGRPRVQFVGQRAPQRVLGRQRGDGHRASALRRQKPQRTQA